MMCRREANTTALRRAKVSYLTKSLYLYKDERDEIARAVIELKSISVTAVDDDEEEEKYYVFLLHARHSEKVCVISLV
jgi:hypothetical protein